MDLFIISIPKFFCFFGVDCVKIGPADLGRLTGLHQAAMVEPSDFVAQSFY